jgi:hypothetical protein
VAVSQEGSMGRYGWRLWRWLGRRKCWGAVANYIGRNVRVGVRMAVGFCIGVVGVGMSLASSGVQTVDVGS